jgi:AbrB family looped-hinge helix DNA binding protein
MKKETDSSDSATCQCCKVEAFVTIDERGQMILPKEVRDKAGIKPGDKFIIACWEKEGKVCCLALVKVAEISGMVKDYLGQVMKDMG